jgi:hypothetical protein
LDFNKRILILKMHGTNIKKKIKMDRSHIKKRGLRDTKGWYTLETSGKQEKRKTEKQLEKIGNQGSG